MQRPIVVYGMAAGFFIRHVFKFSSDIHLFQLTQMQQQQQQIYCERIVCISWQ